jgi:hypothetical protein
MKHRFLACSLLCAVVAGAYAASPFVSLYQMGEAARRGDVATLCADVAWNDVREGLKEDIADGIAGAYPGAPPATEVASSSDDLPPFGVSFVTGMAGNVVDRTVTPEHLANALATLRGAGVTVRPTVTAAYFASPTRFEVSLRTPQERASDAPLRLQLDFAAGRNGIGWRVTRAWVPEALLSQSDTHAS